MVPEVLHKNPPHVAPFFFFPHSYLSFLLALIFGLFGNCERKPYAEFPTVARILGLHFVDVVVYS